LSARHFEVESEMLMAFLAARHAVEFVPIRVIAAERKSRIRPITDTVRWWKWWRNLNGLPIHISRPSHKTEVREAPEGLVHPGVGG
jgi:hypothetical protein